DQETLPQVGALFQDKYEILGELGTGSFGHVYRGRQTSTGQPVAVKILRLPDNETSGSLETRIARFRRETRVSGELSHPNIVRLIDSGESAGGTLYAVFELVPGVTLRELLAEEGKFGIAETTHLMTQVLDALACAHLRGIVHRDLKPENIMVSKTGLR